MTPHLERRYHRLLRAYPKAWRAENETALLATLDETARPGQKRPAIRESRSLIANGLRARVRSSSVDRSSALRQGLVWGSMVWLGVYASLPILWAGQRRYPSANQSRVFSLAAVVVMVGYPIAVLRPGKKLFTLLGALCAGGLLFDWLRAPIAQGSVNRDNVVASAAIVLPCLAALRWSARPLNYPSVRRSRFWLALPILGLVWTESFFVLVILCSALAVLVGALGAARFDPRGPMAAAFLLSTVELSRYVLIVLSPYGIFRNGTNDQMARLMVSFQLLVLPAAIIGPLVAILRRHAQAVFRT
jgi:hypothetical protein